VPDDDNAIPLRPAGVPPEAFIPGAGGGGVATPGYDPTVSSPGHDQVVVPWQVPPEGGYPPAPPFVGHDWPLADAAVDLIVERTGLDTDAARALLENWLRGEKVKSRGDVSGPGLGTRPVSLTLEIWSGVAPLGYGSMTYGLGSFTGLVVRGIRVYAPDLLAAGRALDPPLPATQPAPADRQAVAEEQPPAVQPAPTERETAVYEAALRELRDAADQKRSPPNVRGGLFHALRRPPLHAKRDEVGAAAKRVKLEFPTLLQPRGVRITSSRSPVRSPKSPGHKK
jgi:hypothetical protein